jgi:hypothetical protein
MTPVQFITELFGDGWTHSQLPVFLEMLRQAQEDAKRYHLVRDQIACNYGFPGSQSDLRQIDMEVDAARQLGLI